MKKLLIIITTVAFGFMGCAEEQKISPSPEGITPDWGWSGEPTPVEIIGEGFLAQIKKELDKKDKAEVIANVTASLEDYLLSDIIFHSSRKITAVVPPGLPAGTYDLVVTNPDGAVGTLPEAFSVTNISSIGPTTGCPGDPVTISGTDFGPDTGTVTFNGTGATVISWGNTSIKVSAPGGDYTEMTLTPPAASPSTLSGIYSYDDQAVVSITYPVEGMTIYTSNLTVTGTADTDITTVTVTSDQGHNESSLVDPGGNWSVTLSGVTAPSVAITARGTDNCGNTASDSVISVKVVGPLNHFVLATISSPQTAGIPFGITIYAQDAYNNTVINYTGTADLADTTGTINPSITGAFSAGVWGGDVTITTAQAGVTITAADTGEPIKSGVSNTFEVLPGALDLFAFDPISDQAAGIPFLITITAYDQYNNVKSDYYGTADLSDSTWTISPTSTTGGFSSGIWFGNVTISSDQAGVTITATDGPITGVSNVFDVISVGILDYFEISGISGPQTVRTPFTITVTAKDASNQTVVTFTGLVNISDLSGSILPTLSGNFIDGIWTGEVTICQDYIGDKISVDDGDGHTGESIAFDVELNGAAGVHHFLFHSVPTPQIVGQDFTITVEALDACGGLVSNYNGNASISDLSGSISPDAESFSDGLLEIAVNIASTYANDTITITSAGKSVTSNPFNVEAILQVVATIPLDGAENVPTGIKIVVVFNQPINESTLDSATTFYLYDISNGESPTIITGTVSADPATYSALFTPGTTLTATANFRATVTTGVESMSGFTLAEDYSFAFTTGSSGDSSPLLVIHVYPADGATDVRLNTFISATFNKFINPTTVNDSTFMVSGGVTGDVVYDRPSKSIIFYYPEEDLDPDTGYTVTVDGVEDLSGNPCFYSWSFTTGDKLDSTSPAVISKAPSGGAEGVLVDTVITAEFNEQVDPTTLNNNTFRLTVGGVPVSGEITYDASTLTATFNPYFSLDFNTIYAVRIEGVTDMAGNMMKAPAAWSFRTEKPLILFSDAMEGGTGNWTWDPPWALITTDYYSPTHCWTDSPIGNYLNGSNISLTSVAIDFSGSGLTSFNLYFWHHYDIKDNYLSSDLGYLEASTDLASWDTLRTYSQLVNWREEVVDLSAYDDNPMVYLRFRLETDATVVGDGWYIDDVVVTGK
jgi:hypothetical protein